MTKTKSIRASLSIFIVVCMMFSANIISFAASTPYDILQSKGFSKEYLDSISEEAMKKILDSVGNDYVLSAKTETTFLNTDDNFSSTYGAISENTMLLNVTSFELGSDSIINAILVGVEYEWLSYTKPIVRKTDYISVNWDHNLFYLDEDGFFSQCLYKSSSTDWMRYKEYGRPSVGNQGGLGYYADLAYHPITQYKNRGESLIILDTARPLYKGSTYGTSINVNYVHDRKNFVTTSSLSFSYKSFGISVQYSGAFADSASATTNLRYS